MGVLLSKWVSLFLFVEVDDILEGDITDDEDVEVEVGGVTLEDDVEEDSVTGLSSLNSSRMFLLILPMSAEERDLPKDLDFFGF